MTFHIENSQYYYDLFYQLAAFFALIVLVYEGVRRKFPIVSWLLLIVTVRIAVVIGSKLSSVTYKDLVFLWENHYLLPQYSKNMALALGFGLLALFVGKKLLKLKVPVLDSFAVVVPLTMAIQRIGCLLVGCCFGVPTDSFLGIKYGDNSPAFIHQVMDNQIAITDTATHSIHPVPIYIMIYSLIVAFVVFRFRNYWKREGNLAFFSLLLILSGWFVIEFFRDPASNPGSFGEIILGLKKLQIVYLLMMILLYFVIRYRERHFKYLIFENIENPVTNNTLYILILTTLVLFFRNWFETSELTIILFALIPAILGVFYQLSSQFYAIRTKFAIVFVLMVALFSMSQTLPEKKDFMELRMGFSEGNYQSKFRAENNGCYDSNVLENYYKQDYTATGIGFSYNRYNSSNMYFEFGLNSTYGYSSEENLTLAIARKYKFYSFSPFMNFQHKYFTLGFGFSFGKLVKSPIYIHKSEAETTPLLMTEQIGSAPIINFSIGNRKYFYFKYSYFDYFPSAMPGNYNYFEFGTGLGINGLNLHIGGFSSNTVNFGMVIPIKNRLFFQPEYTFFYKNEKEIDYGQYMYSLSLKYQFDVEKKSVKKVKE